MNEEQARARAKRLSVIYGEHLAMRFPDSDCCGVSPSDLYRLFYAGRGFTVIALYVNGEEHPWKA